MIARRVAPGRPVVTGLGLGTAQLGDLFVPVDQDLADEIVDAAWDEGIRYFDTAPHYGLGLAEQRLGVSLAGRPRDEFTVSTKVGRLILDRPHGRERVWDFSADGVRRSLDDSTRRLGLGTIDIAFVHDPEDHLDVALDAAYPVLDDLRRTGVVGAIGVGTRDVPTLLRFARETDVDVVMVAGRLTPLDDTAMSELVPLCHQRGIGIVIAGAFNSGVLATRAPGAPTHFDYGPVPDAVAARVGAIRTVVAAHGATLTAAALAFALAVRPASVVVGAETASQLRDTAEQYRAALRLDLQPAWRELAASGVIRAAPGIPERTYP